MTILRGELVTEAWIPRCSPNRFMTRQVVELVVRLSSSFAISLCGNRHVRHRCLQLSMEDVSAGHVGTDGELDGLS